MDPLSQILSLINVRHVGSSRLAAGGAWSFHFQPSADVKVGAVVAGSCFLRIGDGESRLLQAGDCYLLTAAHRYVLASDPLLSPADGHSLYAEAGGYSAAIGQPETVIVGTGFSVEPDQAPLLRDLLPPLIHIEQELHAAASFGATLQALDRELADPGLGASLMTDRLAHVLLIQALRVHVAQLGDEAFGWLGALDDPRIGPALRRLHADPSHPWTVAELADVSAMSRSNFALRFRGLVGMAPLAYLGRWRMSLAQRELRLGHRSVATIAASLGYQSESAFGNAFKRSVGSAPSRYRQARQAADKPDGALGEQRDA